MVWKRVDKEMCERGRYKLVHEFNMFIVSRSKTEREREMESAGEI
jgi:hypothetical protein